MGKLGDEGTRRLGDWETQASKFTIHYLLPYIHYSLFTIHYSLPTIPYPLSPIHYPLSPKTSWIETRFKIRLLRE